MKLLLAAIFLAVSLSCGTVVRQGTGSSFLIVDSIEAASGAADGEFTTTLESDVVTVVDESRRTFQDPGRATFSLALKDAGTVTAPSTANAITVDRYRVRYLRADGRNTPGVDVPYGFDGAFTVTVFDRSSVDFVLVRAQAKAEAPLAALANTPVVISTLAEITFFGRDQTGRAVSATARIDVHFANWADPR